MKKQIPNLALVLLSLALLWGAGEVLLRLVPGEGEPPFDRSPRFYRAEEAREHPFARGETDPLRVAVVGDSFTKGVGVQRYDRYGARLEWLLNLNDHVRPAVVAVHAKPGTSTYEQVALVEKALEGGAKILLLGVVLNDTEDHARSGELDRWREETLPAPAPGWLARSRALARLWHRVAVARAGRGFVRYYERIYDSGYSGWGRFEAAVEEIDRLCDDRGVPWAAVVFPLLSHDLRKGRYPFAARHRALAEVFERRGVPVLDLLDAFAGLSPVRLQAIPGVDPHPGEIAHRVAAEALLDFLLREGMVGREYRPRREIEKGLHEQWRRTQGRLEGRGE